MRVCFLSTSYPRWGDDPAGHFVAKLARHLVGQQGAEITVLCPGFPGAVARECSEGLTVRRLRYFWPQRLQKLAYGAGIPWNLKRSLVAWVNIPFLLGVFLRELCRLRGHAEIIHAHWGVLGALACLTRPAHGCSVVVTVHGSDLRSRIPPIRWMTCWAIRQADAVTAVSPELTEECRKAAGRDARRCHFVPNGVTFPDEAELHERRASCSPPPGRPHIVSTGRLIPERRYDLLIRSFAALRERFHSVSLTILGDGPQYRPLSELVEELGLQGAVCLPGRVPTQQVADFLSNADMYVSATTSESFGLAVAEAAVHALPIVTTRVGFPGALVVDGLTGYVVDPDDQCALTNAMEKLLSDPERCREAGLKMRQRIRKMSLTWDRAADRLLEIYGALCKDAAL